MKDSVEGSLSNPITQRFCIKCGMTGRECANDPINKIDPAGITQFFRQQLPKAMNQKEFSTFSRLPTWQELKNATQFYYGLGEGTWYSSQVWLNFKRMRQGGKPLNLKSYWNLDDLPPEEYKRLLEMKDPNPWPGNQLKP